MNLQELKQLHLGSLVRLGDAYYRVGMIDDRGYIKVNDLNTGERAAVTSDSMAAFELVDDTAKLWKLRLECFKLTEDWDFLDDLLQMESYLELGERVTEFLSRLKEIMGDYQDILDQRMKMIENEGRVDNATDGTDKL